MVYFVIGVTVAQVVAFILFARAISREMKARDKKMGAQIREVKLIELYDRLEGIMDTFEDYIAEVRSDIDEKRAEVLELSRQAALIYNRVMDAQRIPPRVETPAASESAHTPPPEPPPPPEPAPPPTASRPTSSRLAKKDRASLERFATKAQKVRFLMSLGLPIEDVARELDIGKGEIRLIAELEK